MKVHHVIAYTADTIAIRWAVVGDHYPSGPERAAHDSELRNTAHALADTLAGVMPNFDRAAFLKRCFPHGASRHNEA